jgi:hypothetical protein
MTGDKRRCAGTTARGTRCKLAPLEGLAFCRHHLPRDAKIRRFLARNKEAIATAFITAIADPVVQDLYDHVKDQLGLVHREPLIRTTEGRIEAAHRLTDHYRRHRDFDSLSSLVPSLTLGMKKTDVVKILGIANQSSYRESMRGSGPVRWVYLSEIATLRIDFCRDGIPTNKVSWFSFGFNGKTDGTADMFDDPRGATNF